jgi:hypothetical protein
MKSMDAEKLSELEIVNDCKDILKEVERYTLTGVSKFCSNGV